MLCAELSWNLPSGSEGEDFQILSMYFSLFHNYLPFEIGVALHLNKLESPLPQDALCQVCLKFAFWKRRLLYSVNVYHIYSPISMSRLLVGSTSEVNLGDIIDVTSTSQLQFLPDHIMNRFPFLMLLRHVFVVNISRISISLRNVQTRSNVSRWKDKNWINKHSNIYNINFIIYQYNARNGYCCESL